MKADEGNFPLLESKIELVENRYLQFTPPGLSDIMPRMIGVFLKISPLFKQTDSDRNYIKEMHINTDIKNAYLFYQKR